MIRRKRKAKAYVRVDSNGRPWSFAGGPDAAELYRRLLLVRSMRFLANGLSVSASWTQGNMLAAATIITKTKYKKSKKQLLQAADDIEASLSELRKKVKVIHGK